ncbi:predicted protein, partial [Nematostella vectensis]
AEVGSLEEEAIKRKERLKALKTKGGSATDEESRKRPADKSSDPVRVIKFRNYVPKDDELKDKKVPDAKPLSVEEEVKDHLEKAKSDKVIEEVDLTNLAPRKPDWDLKRDVAKKLEKLERRTQSAIVEIIRDRLQEGKEKEDLAAAVNAAAAAEQGYQ